MAQIINLWFSFQASLWYDDKFWDDDMFSFEESCSISSCRLFPWFFFQTA
jgi:hypothetical protein